MRIGIIGTGHIGKTLARKLMQAGHEVQVANSRGPETISADLTAHGVRAVTASDATKDVDVLILSIQFSRIPDVAPLLYDLPADTLVIDTSNYYPARDSRIEAVDTGQTESEWVAAQLGRPVVKAWNAIGSDSFARLGKPAGDADRLAIPVAAENDRDRRTGMSLVEETGFDAVDAGELANSWRQQPGTPCYCTDLTRAEMPAALAAADAARSSKRRDLARAIVMERLEGSGISNPDADYLVRLHRAIFM